MTDFFKNLTGLLADWVEIAASVIIGIAAIEATLHALPLFLRRTTPPEAKENVRLRLGRWLAVALEFELAADILRTAIAPTWAQIGQLAAIAGIRTLLNYFLEQEIQRAAAREGLRNPAGAPNAADAHSTATSAPTARPSLGGFVRAARDGMTSRPATLRRDDAPTNQMPTREPAGV